MNISILLRNILRKITIKDYATFRVSVAEQEKFLWSLPEPEDDYMRSFYQYKSTMFMEKWWLNSIMKVSAFFIIPIYEISARMRSKLITAGENCDAVFIADGISTGIIQDSINERYHYIITERVASDIVLDRYDLIFLHKQFKKCRFSFYFKLKILLKIGMYSAQIKKHNPKAIISYSENSFTSSLATQYCEEKGIQHINVMHGEKLFNLKNSFFRFSEFYVWDSHYVNLFLKLRGEHSQFKVELPYSMQTVKIENKENKKYFMTYYLGIENKEIMVGIKEAFDILKAAGKECAVRIHPRTENDEVVRHIFKEYDVQDKNNLSLNESMSDTECVASLISTVLFEGWNKQKTIVIDDYSQTETYLKLKDLDYIMLKKPHYLLSQIIKNVAKGNHPLIKGEILC